MSTRASICVRYRKDNGHINRMWLYHHYDGGVEYLGMNLKRFLSGLDMSVLCGTDVITQILKGKVQDEGNNDNGFELADDLHGDIEYLYIIDLETLSISAYNTAGCDLPYISLSELTSRLQEAEIPNIEESIDKIIVDGRTYENREQALKEFEIAAMSCDGSEQERMSFAYFCIKEGYKNINTYNNKAE